MGLVTAYKSDEPYPVRIKSGKKKSKPHQLAATQPEATTPLRKLLISVRGLLADDGGLAPTRERQGKKEIIHIFMILSCFLFSFFFFFFQRVMVLVSFHLMPLSQLSLKATPPPPPLPLTPLINEILLIQRLKKKKNLRSPYFGHLSTKTLLACLR